MKAVIPRTPGPATVSVPGSKSYTHRALIAAALAEGTCDIENPLISEDTLLTLRALRQMGTAIERHPSRVRVHGRGGTFAACPEAIDLGNSGTSMRLLASVAALGQGTYTFTGIERMRQRPIQALLDGLAQLGVSAHAVHANGCPPVEIVGGTARGGRVALDCSTSSQYLSALLMMAPLTGQGADIRVIRGPVSRPYIDMTVAVLQHFGVEVRQEGYARFAVAGGQSYHADRFGVEADYSQAGYFWAAAAIAGSVVTVRGTARNARQGDVRFTELLERMGCRVNQSPDGIRVEGGKLRAIEADLSDMPDMVPTLAVVAAFAQGTTFIHNVAHLKVKESDRLQAVAQELSKLGIEVRREGSGLSIRGGTPVGAEIETYGDHRIAMSFALAGLRTPGILIRDERCVEKSFPEFWQVFEAL